MRALAVLLALAGCILEGPDLDLPGECVDLQASFEADLAAAQACETWDECGQILTGTSCGCTRDLVVRHDADVAGLQATLAAAGEQSCDLGLGSDCDCPTAYGFDCVEGACAWDYAAGTYLPDCQAERGDFYEVYGAALKGDDLVVSVGQSGGCGTFAYTLCWPDGTFMESHPVQVNLELYLDNQDKCEAWLKEEVTVSLAPLRAAWKAAYQQSNGTITVHLGGQTVDYSF